MRFTGFVVTAALLLLFVPAAAAEEPDVVTRLYDVGPLLQPDRPPAFESLGLPPSGLDLVPEEEDEDEPRSFLDGDALAELFDAALPGVWEDDQTLVELEGDRLLVRAGADAQAAVSGLLAALWTEATRRIEIRGTRLLFSPEDRGRLGAGLLDAARSGHVDARMRDALIAAASRSSSASTVVRPGSRGALGRVRATSYVSDYAVEIAQDSVVGDPWVTDLSTGWFVDVQAHALHDGSVLLDGTAQTAMLEEPIRRLPLEAEPFGSVDLPACRVLRTLVNARVAVGECLVTTAAPHGERGPLEMLLLTPTLHGERARPGTLRRYDLSALTAMPPRWRLARTPSPLAAWLDVGALNPPRFERLDAPDPILEVDDLVETFRSTLGDEAWEREGVWLSASEYALLAHHDAATLGALDRLLAQRERRFADQSVVVRLLAVDGERSETLTSAALRVAHGRPAVFQAGVERAYVADWEVEVAQEARAGDPRVATVFGGLALTLQLDPAPVPDRFPLVVDLSWTLLDPHLETRRTHNECTGVLEIPKSARVDLRTELVLRAGETQKVDAGTLEDGRRAVVVLTLGR